MPAQLFGSKKERLYLASLYTTMSKGASSAHDDEWWKFEGKKADSAKKKSRGWQRSFWHKITSTLQIIAVLNH